MGFVKVPSPQSIPAQRTGATWDLALSLLHVRSLHTGRVWWPDSARVSSSFCFRVLQVLCAVLITRDETRGGFCSGLGSLEPLPGTSSAGFFCLPALDPCV